MGWWVVLATLVTSACVTTTGTPEDAGTPDAAVPRADAGSPDAAVTTDAGVQGDGGFQWPVETGPVTITPHSSWKNQITPTDPFVVPAHFDQPDQPRWVKFSVLMRDPTKVYYQDSVALPFHYDFASLRLDPFVGDTRAQFDAVSLHAAGQEVILGAVLFPSLSAFQEYGIQLVRQDAFHPEMVRILVELVRASITAPGALSFYMPTFEQEQSAHQNEAFFTAHNIPLSNPGRWTQGNGCYSTGWALGRLVQVAPEAIDEAYVMGTLLPSDILVTDGVPAELPYVAGVLSLAASTPNSHVAILSQSYGVPFAYLKDETLRTSVLALVGREVAVRVRSTGACSVDVMDVDGELTATQREEILDLRRPQDIVLPPLTALGSISANTDGLDPGDFAHFGGKSANYGVLRTSIPDHVRPAIALSFDLFTAFLDQTVTSGGTLREAINARLGHYSDPPNLTTLPADLAAVQALIRNTAQFNETQKAAILQSLSMFTADERLRFRSSTNIEDSDQFTGAGLYESFSGCIHDDTDADTTGPSHCDATESGERGVFRAIQRTYASFYNQNAFVERLRHHVDESRGAMGVLVHRTFLDEDEQANGVATVWATPGSHSVRLVTQLGAVSVTNPTGSEIPEIVDIYVSGITAYPTLTQSSSLAVLGATVMTWPDDYEALALLLVHVSDRWQTVRPTSPLFVLDLEYKKVVDEGLVVRQVRPLPLPSNTPSQTAFLLPQQTRLCVFQGEAGDVFANHRLKSTWRLTTDGSWLSDAALTQTPMNALQLDYHSGGAQQQLAGDPAALPGAAFVVDMDGLHDRFNVTEASNVRHYDLTTGITRLTAPRDGPLVTLTDAYMTVGVGYDTPVTTMDWMGMNTTTTQEFVTLTPCIHDVPVEARDVPVTRTATGARGVSVTIRFFHPSAPTGATAGYTAPLRAWDHTTLAGFSTEPMELRGYWSQTYRPGHHNFSEEFIFEPRLEPDISAAALQELATSNVISIYVSLGSAVADIRVMGADGTWRAW